MTIDKKQDGTTLTIALSGRLDTTTAPQLEEELKSALEGVTALRFDFKELSYISSAGLRVMLATQKKMNNQGTMVICGANDIIKDTFDMTGFLEILTLED